jgi:metal transporter CNNM
MWHVLVATLPIAAQAISDPLIKSLSAGEYIYYVLWSLVLVLFGGCMSGLNVGTMSLDEFELEQKVSAWTEAEKRQARKLIPIIKRHHWLLVSIVLANASAAEALPICLNQIMHDSLSIMFSVLFVLFCSEILPQAILTGPNQLQITASMVPLLKAVMIITFPLSYPLPKLWICC